MPIVGVDGAIAVAAVVMTIVTAIIVALIVALIVATSVLVAPAIPMATVFDVMAFDLTAILTMIALGVALAATIVVALAAVGQCQATGAKQGERDEQVADEFHPGILLESRGREGATADSCASTVRSCG